MKIHALRLHPGEDPLRVLDDFARTHNLEAACLLTCVGSLQKVVLRFANRPESSVLDGKYEIVAMSGVISHLGSHCHIAVSDNNGRTLGAHLMEGSQVFTTAEIILAELDDLRFLRTFDPQAGYPELDIQPSYRKE